MGYDPSQIAVDVGNGLGTGLTNGAGSQAWISVEELMNGVGHSMHP